MSHRIAIGSTKSVHRRACGRALQSPQGGETNGQPMVAQFVTIFFIFKCISLTRQASPIPQAVRRETQESGRGRDSKQSDTGTRSSR